MSGRRCRSRRWIGMGSEAMKMIKGREGFIYKTRLEEQSCRAWLRDSSQAVGVGEGGG